MRIKEAYIHRPRRDVKKRYSLLCQCCVRLANSCVTGVTRQFPQLGPMLKMKLSALLATAALAIFGGVTLLSRSVNAEDGSARAIAQEPGKSYSDEFKVLLSSQDREEIDAVFTVLEHFWDSAHIPPLLEVANYASSFHTSKTALDLIAKKTDANIRGDVNEWYFWLWNQPEKIPSDYGNFKADLYRAIDPVFEEYFRERQSSARIRLDEVRWGGVRQDGIPPLRSPKMISPSKADYLEDDNVVFGIEVNGDARAYPKRVLAWHEMFVDTVGGVDVAGVYCTLCGTVVLYKTNHKGTDYHLGTSGFLYRSNKLMYDRDTQSLWNTLTGEPVIGPLVDQGIALEHMSVVTTTWGEWKRRHPDTQVLSKRTGHRRDYGEGVAYNEYFATDRLMFNTPFRDDRLKNKQEVLALRFPGAPHEQLAIDTDFLEQNPVYGDAVGPQSFIVLTDASGANRVYDPGNVKITLYDRDSTATDSNGKNWKVTEAALVAEDGRRLERLPYHRAFWFGWRAAFPDTRLVS